MNLRVSLKGRIARPIEELSTLLPWRLLRNISRKNYFNKELQIFSVVATHRRQASGYR
jgi:hypothetical protein